MLMNSNSHHSRKAAFSLVEMLSVIAIIVILAGLVVFGVGFAKEKQARAQAQVQIALIEKALEAYKADMGKYPSTGNTPAANLKTPPITPTGTGTSDVFLYQALFKEGYDYTNTNPTPTTWTKAKKIYLPELDPRGNKQKWVTPVSSTATPPATSAVKDPWGNEYCYRSAKDATGANNAATNNPDFDLWSMGKDGLSDPSNPADPVNGDDIKNF
jgi:general secretion pathway protein G